MRHRKKLNHLSRKSSHRKAMLANMASSLILHKRISTTTAKAKELRTFIEPIITRSREDSTHSRRMAFKNLRDKFAVSELFREVATKVGERPGGYTRIIKVGNRQGDSADMCIIELVDYNENLLIEKTAAAKAKSTRRRRSAKKKESVEATGSVTTADASEDEAPEPEAKTESMIEDAGAAEAKAEETEKTVETIETEETPVAKPEEDEDKEKKKGE